MVCFIRFFLFCTEVLVLVLVNLYPLRASSSCPVVCLLGIRVGNIHARITQRIIALAFLSVKRTILMNWKIRKPDCCNKNTWLKDFLDLLSMEKATSILKDNENKQAAPWTVIREYLNNRTIT